MTSLVGIATIALVATRKKPMIADAQIAAKKANYILQGIEESHRMSSGTQFDWKDDRYILDR